MSSPQQLISIGDIARLQAAQLPNKTALIDGDLSVDYRSLDRRTNQAANGLLDYGIELDERVCYLGKNSLSYFELLLAVSKSGAVTVPLNWRLSAAEIAYIVSDTKARLLFVDSEFSSVLEEVRRLLPNAPGVVMLGEYESWIGAHSSDDPNLQVSSETDVLQLYTSGTTGKPKGVRISNRALLSGRARDSAPTSPAWNKWQQSDVSLIAMPCFHIGGTGFGLNTLYNGATGVVIRHFQADRQLDLLLDHNITKHFVVPSALRFILDDRRVSTIEFPALKYISYGASPIPLDLMKECIDAFGCGFVQKYGMTETSGTCVALGAEDHTIPENDKMKSVGKPLEGVELRIVNSTGVDVPLGESGEIVVRSSTNMSGYWQNEQATKDAYFDHDWLRTGDIGRLDHDGYLYILDRLKDMIVSGGENVYSAEVEAALTENPAIADAAVIGVPDEKWGEAVKAFVVLKDGHSDDADTIITDCRARIAAYKVPKSVEFVQTLPRNGAGKVLKNTLRQQHWSGHDRRVN